MKRVIGKTGQLTWIIALGLVLAAVIAGACGSITTLPTSTPSLAITTAEDLRQALAEIEHSNTGQASADALWEYLATQDRIPVVFGEQVFFLYKGPADRVTWRGDFNGWDRGTGLEGRSVGKTDLWLAETTLPIDARANYKIVLDGQDWILDPANPHIQPGGLGNNSIVTMPEFRVTTDTDRRSDVAPGTLSTDLTIHSEHLGYAINYRVYTPANYDEFDNLPVLYVTDGNDWAYEPFGAMSIVLDNLIADGRIQPVMAVFIDAREPGNPTNNRREIEFLERPEDYARFVAEELVPAVDQAYRTNPSPDGRLIQGTSYGGIIASYIMARFPDHFHKVALFSPTFWVLDNPTTFGDPVRSQALQLIRSTVEKAAACGENSGIQCPALPAAVFLSSGIPAWDVGDISGAAVALATASMPVRFIEAQEGHTWGHWSGLLDEMLVYFFSPPLSPSVKTSLRTLEGDPVSIPELEASIDQIMGKAGVTGLSMAIINDNEIVYQQAFGQREQGSEIPNDQETIFGAASFSKPVFAYLVMLLVEEGIIDLDKPLHEYLEQPLTDYPAYADLGGDKRYQEITARMILSHSTGFPNWRFLTEDGKLSFMFPPGSQFSYSGEGIVLLQMAVEEITGRSLEELAQEKVFTPLAMSRSSYVWQEAYEDNHAVPHDEFQRPQRLNRRTTPDAAGSMTTTATDYARFLVAILNPPTDLQEVMTKMLMPQISITSEAMFGPGSRVDSSAIEEKSLAWSLGWGRFDSEHGPAFFHTGHDFGWQNYTVTFPGKGIGIVLLSNSDNFESVAREIAAAAIGDTVSPFDWLGYETYDPSKERMPPPTPVAVAVDRTILETYVGSYELMKDQVIVVSLVDDTLVLGDGKQEGLPLAAETDTRFFADMDDIRVTFVLDGNGGVTGLILETQGLELPLAPRLE